MSKKQRPGLTKTVITQTTTKFSRAPSSPCRCPSASAFVQPTSLLMSGRISSKWHTTWRTQSVFAIAFVLHCTPFGVSACGWVTVTGNQLMTTALPVASHRTTWIADFWRQSHPNLPCSLSSIEKNLIGRAGPTAKTAGHVTTTTPAKPQESAKIMENAWSQAVKLFVIVPMTG